MFNNAVLENSMSCDFFILIKPFGESSCPAAGGGAILEETTPIGIVMLHLKIKVISQEDLVLICCCDPLLKRGEKTHGKHVN